MTDHIEITAIPESSLQNGNDWIEQDAKVVGPAAVLQVRTSKSISPDSPLISDHSGIGKTDSSAIKASSGASTASPVASFATHTAPTSTTPFPSLSNGVPVDPPVPRLQLIDDSKHFNDELLSYINQYSSPDDRSGLNYHIVSVFGSQSTGKSTLLNRLFGTSFDVMDEHKRQQTTKGIWFSHANYIASNVDPSGSHPNDKHIFVLDVEGVDGHEKADDKDFERKSALFALASTEILIINIWEHQVGLYQGANMELLKTVMEVNLSLFHSTEKRQKCLLLFVVRDFTGITPLDNLEDNLRADLNRIWDELNKPEGCENDELASYFDLAFSAIAHKHFQEETFELDIKKLGDEFYEDVELFKPEYHRGIPIDAWAIYSRQIWEQIELNKDLDLPTQQILVARFRCDEISNQAYGKFYDSFNEVDFGSIEEAEEVASIMKRLRNDALEEYDSQASRYQAGVCEERRRILQKKVDDKLGEVQGSKLDELSKLLTGDFSETVTTNKRQNKEKSFGEVLVDITRSFVDRFKKEASIYCISEDFNFDRPLEVFEESLNKSGEQLKSKEQDILISRSTKRFQAKLKDRSIDILSSPSENSWDELLKVFHKLEHSFLDRYKVAGGYDLKLGLDEKSNEDAIVEIRKSFWIKFKEIIHDFMTEDTASRILRNSFEDGFKYDEEGLPNIWRNVTEVDQQFTKARGVALSLLPILSVAKLSSTGEEIIPDIDIAHEDEDDPYFDDTDADEETNRHYFGHLLTASQQNNILHRLKKEIDAIYVDAKRSVIANRTAIPWWMYALVVALGWNEFMAVLRNPVLVMLVIVAATVLYIGYHTQMLGPMASVAKASLIQAKTVVKQKLRDVLLEEEAAPSKAIELNDLTEKEE
ncbi:DEKNAAC102940 [Brettanomyces naardenensis]|uniref:DEKNAAC102940 n=1 Tax=Brettanomyces naardenensis TaxID=13370 RepID=A0A448YLU6_BRENA|nr:DEKNAAC102940 [Brettanomyces naardenensis]